MRPLTRIARGDRDRVEDPYRASSPPIYQTATFAQQSAESFGEFDYSRSGNPTRANLERAVATLENASHGLAFGSGMAALAAVTRLVRPGERIVASTDLYGGAYRLLSEIVEPQGVTVEYVDLDQLEIARRALSKPARLVLFESPTNPLHRVIDTRAISTLAKRAGARVAVDNTMLSPYRQRPLDLGADLVVHSATKFLSGHADLTAGLVLTNDPVIAERLEFILNAEGTGLAPFEAWLLQRGLRTLGVRMDRQEANTRVIAEFLAAQPWVRRVNYAGLPGSPGHELLIAQATGAGSVLAFETGDYETSRRFVEALELFSITVSFGSVCSLASLPCRMSHASIPESVRNRRQLPEDLVRLSIGIEDANDLLDDLSRAASIALRETEHATDCADLASV
ncbi:MAG: cystathionine beta-lyase [Phycisphaerales bacterium]